MYITTTESKEMNNLKCVSRRIDPGRKSIPKARSCKHAGNFSGKMSHSLCESPLIRCLSLAHRRRHGFDVYSRGIIDAASFTMMGHSHLHHPLCVLCCNVQGTVEEGHWGELPLSRVHWHVLNSCEASIDITHEMEAALQAAAPGFEPFVLINAGRFG